MITVIKLFSLLIVLLLVGLKMRMLNWEFVSGLVGTEGEGGGTGWGRGEAGLCC